MFIKRIIIVFILYLLVSYSLAWLAMIVAFFSALFFSNFIELVILGIMLDVLFSQSPFLEGVFAIGFFYAAISIVLYLFAYFLRTRLRL